MTEEVYKALCVLLDAMEVAPVNEKIILSDRLLWSSDGLTIDWFIKFPLWKSNSPESRTVKLEIERQSETGSFSKSYNELSFAEAKAKIEELVV